MAKPSVRVLQTVEHRCGYYPDRWARNLVIDPKADRPDMVYDAVTLSGFRRAGDLIFRPHCNACTACRATRIPVSGFSASRYQRRNLKRNADLEVRRVRADFTAEYFHLYDRYLAARHPNGGMDNPNREDFESFLLSQWSHSFFLEFRCDGRLVGVAVCDRLATGISAVYTFYEPDETHRGLGTFGILKQIETAQELGLNYVYLGYWLDGHPKMAYKARFKPIEVFDRGRWQPLALPTNNHQS